MISAVFEPKRRFRVLSLIHIYIFLENKFFLVGRYRVNAAPEMADVYWLVPGTPLPPGL